MDYTLISIPSFDIEHCTVIGYFESCALPVKADVPALKQLAKKLTKKGDALWHQTEKQHTLLVHCGNEKETTLKDIYAIIQSISNTLNQQKITSSTIYLPQIKNVTPNQQIEK